MRNFVLAGAAFMAFIAAAAPATAQYYHQPYGYGPVAGASWGDPNEYFRRLYNIRRSLGSVPPNAAYQLDAEARRLERQVSVAARNGLDPYETQILGDRIYNLEIRLGQVKGGWRQYNGYYDGDRRGHRYRDDD